jgi:hypothetical protein
MSWRDCEWVEDVPWDRDLVLGSDGGFYCWPMCIVPGCGNRSCMKLGSPRCYPHTIPGVPLANDILTEEPELAVSSDE